MNRNHFRFRRRRGPRHPTQATALCVRAEPLERRTMLAFGSLGPEFPVNTTTADNQYGAAIAADASGNFVVAWGSFSEGSSWDVHARRYDASGTPLGGEVAVNTTTADDQFMPAVASDGAGGFVVAWFDASASGIYARRFDAGGSPLGDEIRVDAVSNAAGGAPAVASDADGDFVVAWNGYMAGSDILARRFNAAGEPLGEEFAVSEPTWGTKSEPSVGMDSDGDFTVAWTDRYSSYYGYDGYGTSQQVRMRRYDSAGQPVGGESTLHADGQLASVAMDADGDFVVAWQAYYFSPLVVAQRFDAAGQAVGDRIDVTSVGTEPSVALGADGTAFVAWQQVNGDFSSYDVHGQRFDVANQPLGPDFRVNASAAGAQVSASVAAAPSGSFVVAWNSVDQDGSGWGVYGQRFGEGGVPPPPPPPSITVSDVTVTEGNEGTVSAAFTVRLSGASGDVVTVDYATADAGASAGSDYVAASGTVTFAPGETSKAVAVAVRGDVIDEFDQEFALNLLNPVNADIADSQGLATILDDDAAPTITINDVSLAEGRTGTTAFAFTVSLSAPSEKTVQANFSTANGTATVANRDYVAASGALVFSPGQTTRTIVVQVVGDKRREANEYFVVNLSSVTDAVVGDAQGRGTILNDDGPPK